jgi:hypothetical protein
LHDLAPPNRGALSAPTSMALSCRWRSRPQHRKRHRTGSNWGFGRVKNCSRRTIGCQAMSQMGSFASIFAGPGKVCFTPDNDQKADVLGCPQSARKRHRPNFHAHSNRCSFIREPPAGSEVLLFRGSGDVVSERAICNSIAICCGCPQHPDSAIRNMRHLEVTP